MFRLCSLLVLLWGLLRLPQLQCKLILCNLVAVAPKVARKKVYGEVTNASATGPVSDGTTSIICTDITKFPYKTKTGHYFFLKVNGNYVKVLYTDVDSNWEGDYEVSFEPGAVLTVSSPDTDGKVDITFSTDEFPLFYPATGVIDGNKITVTPNDASADVTGTNDQGVVTVNADVGMKIGTESPIRVVAIDKYYGFITADDGTGTCDPGTLAIGLSGGDAGSSLGVEEGDDLKVYFKSKKCKGKRGGKKRKGRRGKRNTRTIWVQSPEGGEVEVEDLEEFNVDDEEVDGEDEFVQFWADTEIND